MTQIPAPSAWRYTHKESGQFIVYQYDTARPKNCNHPNYTPMFTAGQLNQYGQACFEEGVNSVHTPDESNRRVMQQALDALLGYKPNSLTHAKEHEAGIIALREALQLLKDGKKVARRGWNGKGLWLELQVPDAHSKMTLPYIFMSYPADAQNTPGARVPWPGAQGGRRRNRPQAHKHHHRPRERRDTARLRRWRSVAGYPARCGAHQVSRVSPPTLHSRRPAARGAAGASIRPLCR
jgi:hypothetical protein